jgi:hypothetical protein
LPPTAWATGVCSPFGSIEWTTQVASRRRELIGALAETVLERSLSPLEHTSIDVALSAVVASNDVPILPMVVDRILTPDRAGDGRDGSNTTVEGPSNSPCRSPATRRLSA